jgi:pimeloyl-ACP methyl ester carboxylesterase
MNFVGILALSIGLPLLLLVAFVLRSKTLRQAPSIEALPERLRAWYRRGHFVDVWGHRVFCARILCTAPPLPSDAAPRPTFVLVHGYPSSSFDYADVVDALARHGDVFTHDHVGFGFSSKPRTGFCYSVFEHADVACAVWSSAALSRAVIVAHDMGDSVVAEVLARRTRGLLPPSLPPSTFAGVLFTNGGMRIRLANLRFGQRVLLTPVGQFLARLMANLDPG